MITIRLNRIETYGQAGFDTPGQYSWVRTFSGDGYFIELPYAQLKARMAKQR
jgi:hypothetical protein